MGERRGSAGDGEKLKVLHTATLPIDCDQVKGACPEISSGQPIDKKYFKVFV
jgi:hypothetical protein